VSTSEKAQKPSKSLSSENQEIKPSEIKTVDQQPSKPAPPSTDSNQKRIERDTKKGPTENQ
jgi:hypothetical protein